MMYKREKEMNKNNNNKVAKKSIISLNRPG